MENEKIRIPLNVKVNGLLTLVLVFSLALYVSFALDLYKKDKSAYVYDDGLNSTQFLSVRLKKEIKGMSDFLATLFLSLSSGEKADTTLLLLSKDRSLISFNAYSLKDGKRKYHVGNRDLFGQYGLNEDFLDSHFKKNPSFEITSKLHFIPYRLKERDFVLIGLLSPNQDYLLTGLFPLDPFVSLLSREGQYSYALVGINGNKKLFLTPSESKFSKSFADSILGKISEKEVKEGVETFLYNEKEFMAGYSRLKDFNLVVLASVPLEKAFLVAKFLMNKSLTFGGIVIGLGLILGFFFSRRITSHLKKLTEATRLVAAGDFETKIDVRTGDEIGALSKSFNFMSEEILRYMEQMKEKARLENEVEVARLVQSTFFPPELFSGNSVKGASYFTPASECGGDWWGHLKLKNKDIFVIADATGHGVPAALLTATIHCCFSNLKSLEQSQSDILESPSKILKFANHAVSEVGGRIMMTCFVAIWDPEKKKMIYSNASHNPPLLYKLSNADATKNDFKPLLDSNGPRLGHKADAEYEDAEVAINTGDKVFFYTDGIIEAKNNEGKEFGQRRLLKTLASVIKNDSEQIIQTIKETQHEFLQDMEYDDDVTLFVTEFLDANAVVESSSGSKIVLGIHDEQLKNTLLSHSEFSSSDVTVLKEGESIPENLDEKSFFVVDVDFIDEWGGEEFLNKFHKNLFIVSPKEDEFNVDKILSKYPVNHLVGANAGNLVGEISSNIQKSINDEIWGIERYLKAGTIVEKMDVASSHQVKVVVDEMIKKFDLTGYFDSPVEYLRTMSNELLTNAVYDAVKNDDGDSVHLEKDRSEDVELSSRELVTFKMGMDEKYIAISVQDNFGGLNRDIILKNLARCFREKTVQQKAGGAGLGLYMVFNLSNQLVINIKNDFRTEVIAIIDYNKRFKNYKKRITSFHFFQEGKS